MKKIVLLTSISLILLSLAGCGNDTVTKTMENHKQSEKVSSEDSSELDNSQEAHESSSKEDKSEVKEGSNVVKTENQAITRVKSLNQSGKTTTLGNGTWKVGRDIAPGHYMLTTSDGSGNISTDNNNDCYVNIILGSQEEAEEDEEVLTQYEAYLFNGAEIDISDLTAVNFTAVNEGKDINKGTLCAGDYMVGSDIKPGRYKIQVLKGSGNMQSDKGSLNEIMGFDDDEVRETTRTLQRGEMISTDVPLFSITPA